MKIRCLLHQLIIYWLLDEYKEDDEVVKMLLIIGLKFTVKLGFHHEDIISYHHIILLYYLV
jgi:hypothetical protein